MLLILNADIGGSKVEGWALFTYPHPNPPISYIVNQSN